jgi:hypothetical protein
MLLTALLAPACSSTNGTPASGVPPAIARLAPGAAPETFSLHPSRIHIPSPQSRYQREYVHGFGESGTIEEDCIQKGVAEVAGTGLRANTLVADVIPMATGHCTATFTNGSGAKLTLPVSVGK